MVLRLAKPAPQDTSGTSSANLLASHLQEQGIRTRAEFSFQGTGRRTTSWQPTRRATPQLLSTEATHAAKRPAEQKPNRTEACMMEAPFCDQDPSCRKPWPLAAIWAYALWPGTQATSRKDARHVAKTRRLQQSNLRLL